MQRFRAIVAELATYAGVSTDEIGRMTYIQASMLYAAMRSGVNAAK